MREGRRLRLAIWCALLPGVSAAQDLPGIGPAVVDSVRAAAPPTLARRWALDADAAARFDHVGDLPAGREDLQRVRSQLDLGLTVHPTSTLELVTGLEAALGSDDNADNRLNNDNEPSDDLNLDRAVAIWRPTPHVAVQAGLDALPWTLTGLVWDDDLHPAGGAVTARLPSGTFDRWRLAAGWFGVRSLADSWVRLATGQAGWSWQDGGPRGADVRVGVLHFDHDDALVTDGLARTNRVRNGRFVSNFDLVDVLAAGRWDFVGVPTQLQAEWIENLGADTDASGVRLAVRAGDARHWRGLQVHYAYHRIERDAVLAAFDSDDWWFHSAFLGHRAGIEVEPWRNVRAGLSGSVERRDDLSTWTRRVLFDVRIAGGVAP